MSRKNNRSRNKAKIFNKDELFHLGRYENGVFVLDPFPPYQQPTIALEIIDRKGQLIKFNPFSATSWCQEVKVQPLAIMSDTDSSKEHF